MYFDPIYSVAFYPTICNQIPTPVINCDFKKALLPLTENKGRKNALKIIITGLFIATATLYLKTNLSVVPLVPCVPNVTAYNVDFYGDCSLNQKLEAFALQNVIYEQRQIDLKAEGRRMADESNKIWQASIDQTKKEKEEFIRKFYPSPEEVEAKSLRTQREIHCQMDEMLAWWPLHTPSCVKNEIELLGADMSDNCTTIKKLYRQQSVLVHPDHNDAPDANEKFNRIAEAYKKICP